MMADLTIVVPAYNEEQSLNEVVSEALGVVRGKLDRFEIIIVDDGSTDGTKEAASALANEHEEVRVVSHNRNMGSGMGIRTGIQNAAFDLITYIPADGQFDAVEIEKFIEAMADADIVIGARLERSDYSWFRLLSSKVFIVLANLLFRTDFRDVNWVHMWKKEIFGQVDVRSKGVFLLEEILVRASRKGFRVKEIDSKYKPRVSGKAKGSHPVTIIKTICEMLGLWCELSFGKK